MRAPQRSRVTPAGLEARGGRLPELDRVFGSCDGVEVRQRGLGVVRDNRHVDGRVGMKGMR